MVKSDLVIKLIKSYGNDELFHKVAWEIVEDEKIKGNQILSNNLKNIIRSNSPTVPTASLGKGFSELANLNEHKELFELRKSDKTVEDIAIPKELERSLKMIVKEVKNREKLHSWGIKDFGRILLYGPPGTGKTLWAYVLANVLNYDLVYVRLDTLISSYLGETGKNIRKIFDLAHDYDVVLFIDEFDAIAKMRDDSRELGELKRVVNVLIQNIDDFFYNSILVAATNHSHLLDKAIWRRFDEVLKFDLPDKDAREKIFNIHTRQVPLKNVNIKELTQRAKGFSGDDIKNVVRHAVRFAIQNNRDCLNSEDFDGAIKIVNKRKSNENDKGKYITKKGKITLAKSYRKKGHSYEEIANMINESISTAWRYVNKY